jgi:hypothetical protein
MPNTTAVRKAKDIRAASTLSLVRSSIALPPASVDASCPAPTSESRDRFAGCQAKSLLQRNNSMLLDEVSGLPHCLMHKKHGNTSLIQEVFQSKCAVLTLHSDCRASRQPNPAPIASFKFLYSENVAAGIGQTHPRAGRGAVATVVGMGRGEPRPARASTPGRRWPTEGQNPARRRESGVVETWDGNL